MGGRGVGEGLKSDAPWSIVSFEAKESTSGPASSTVSTMSR